MTGLSALNKLIDLVLTCIFLFLAYLVYEAIDRSIATKHTDLWLLGAGVWLWITFEFVPMLWRSYFKWTLAAPSNDAP